LSKDGCVVAFFYADEKTAGDGEDTRVGGVIVAKIEDTSVSSSMLRTHIRLRRSLNKRDTSRHIRRD
jgi:hypothetical protein